MSKLSQHLWVATIVTSLSLSTLWLSSDVHAQENCTKDKIEKVVWSEEKCQFWHKGDLKYYKRLIKKLQEKNLDSPEELAYRIIQWKTIYITKKIELLKAQQKVFSEKKEKILLSIDYKYAIKSLLNLDDSYYSQYSKELSEFVPELKRFIIQSWLGKHYK